MKKISKTSAIMQCMGMYMLGQKTVTCPFEGNGCVYIDNNNMYILEAGSKGWELVKRFKVEEGCMVRKNWDNTIEIGKLLCKNCGGYMDAPKCVCHAIEKVSFPVI